jgi:hypothetical protein
MLTQHQSYPGDYACTLGRAAMLGGSGMDSCTRVPAARHTCSLWPCRVMPESECRHFSRPRCMVKIYPIQEALGWSDSVPRSGREAYWVDR